MMISMRTGIVTKLLGAALRVFVFAPSVMGIGIAIEGLIGLGSTRRNLGKHLHCQNTLSSPSARCVG